jgi:hypothetical protein
VASVENPLGVCSVFENDRPVVTCPVRFRQDWLVIEDAAKFFFLPGTTWTALREVRLDDADGSSAGHIDFVLVALDDQGNVSDFGALEVQAVYISGNVSKPFAHYIQNRKQNHNFAWKGNVRPDYLSSSRKRLVPQLIYKGGILMAWSKKIAVSLQDTFFATLPQLPVVPPEEADVAWFIYKFEYDANAKIYQMVRDRTVYTRFKAALDEITTPQVGSVEGFIKNLQSQLLTDKKIYPPVTLELFEPVHEEDEVTTDDEDFE